MNAGRTGAYDLVCRRVGGCPLWVIGLSGILGVLVDLDHPLAYYVLGYRAPASLRIFHIPIAVIGSLVLLSISACLGGLLGKVVLTKRVIAVGRVLRWAGIVAALAVGAAISLLIWLALGMGQL